MRSEKDTPQTSHDRCGWEPEFESVCITSTNMHHFRE